MLPTATITSKGQLTIPTRFFQTGLFKIGEKVVLVEDNKAIRIVPALSLVGQIAGSLKTDKKIKPGTIDEVIEEAKKKYFSKIK